MPTRAEPFKPYKAPAISKYREDDDTWIRFRESKKEKPYRKWYGHRWAKARKFYLMHHPLCAECERNGRPRGALVVDHIVPHKGDKKLFWDSTNWQSLCVSCHASKTGRGL